MTVERRKHSEPTKKSEKKNIFKHHTQGYRFPKVPPSTIPRLWVVSSGRPCAVVHLRGDSMTKTGSAGTGWDRLGPAGTGWGQLGHGSVEPGGMIFFSLPREFLWKLKRFSHGFALMTSIGAATVESPSLLFHHITIYHHAPEPKGHILTYPLVIKHGWLENPASDLVPAQDRPCECPGRHIER